VLDEATYICDSCSEEIVVTVDRTAGSDQEYVEDCPVCCRPHVITVRIERDESITLDARPE
jgi:DNA replicative helicase MCM subunit Mcm2 (Cdc46/Mcm family)